MSFPRLVPTRFSDTFTVDLDEDADIVVESAYGSRAYLTPAQARRFAKVLKKAARRAERI